MRRTALIAFAVTAGCSQVTVTPVENIEADRDAGFRRVRDAGWTPVARDAGTASTPRDAGFVDAGPPPPSTATCATDVAGPMNAMDVPGISAGIVKNGQLVCTTASGYAKVDDQVPVTPETLFAWASVSKTLTGVAVMILVDEGRIDLDDDVDQHLPYTIDNPSCPNEPITFRQLMTHVSSVIDGPVYDDLYTTGDSPILLGDFVRDYLTPSGRYYDATDNFDYDCPGTYNDYSNIGFALLGHLVEQVSGMAFDDFVRQRIFAPLGMAEASFLLAGVDETKVAVPYASSAGSFTALGHIGFPTYPDGGLRTSVVYLARFLAMMAGEGVYDGTRILSADAVREMRRIQYASLDAQQGLVWFYASYGSRTNVLGHDGSDPGSSSMMFYDPTDGAGVLLVANGDWYDANEGSPEADALVGALFEEARRY